MRYEYLLDAVRTLQPRSILEIGTWNGHRALQMLTLSPGATYYGFDLFEDGTPEVDAEEKNVKPHHSLKDVSARLEGYKFQLHKGNTRETLKAFKEPIDFAWIDGGHSVETIESDWLYVKRLLIPGATVFFDDYYSGIDTEKYGCNKVVEQEMHTVIPHKDPVVPSGWVQIVQVFPEAVDPYLQTR